MPASTSLRTISSPTATACRPRMLCPKSRPGIRALLRLRSRLWPRARRRCSTATSRLASWRTRLCCARSAKKLSSFLTSSWPSSAARSFLRTSQWVRLPRSGRTLFRVGSTASPSIVLPWKRPKRPKTALNSPATSMRSGRPRTAPPREILRLPLPAMPRSARTCLMSASSSRRSCATSVCCMMSRPPRSRLLLVAATPLSILRPACPIPMPPRRPPLLRSLQPR
mmetsp:Transcript_68641/g.100514  ORF Transcript_68641/g.100514 Transcript_68641/m.100514 type:complete len:225 (-) Transcript_68641:614-1288(-)